MFNLPAVFIVLAITFLLIRGTRESAGANLIMVGIKIVILMFFIVVALTTSAQQLHAVLAARLRRRHRRRPAMIFFAYIGFDAVSTGSEEASNPGKDLPLAIIGSLVICTVFYILIAVGALGIATPDDR